jgi:hypothetical protein
MALGKLISWLVGFIRISVTRMSQAFSSCYCSAPARMNLINVPYITVIRYCIACAYIKYNCIGGGGFTCDVTRN